MPKILKSLEFEFRWGLRKLIREHGATVLVKTGAAQKLVKNLGAIEALKAAKHAA
jgi:hypothetical protein